MVTSKSEYERLLASIQDKQNVTSKALLVPSNEPIYKIDLESRQVEAPEFLSIQNDHQAETIYFEIDRYFGRVDLSTTIGVVQYKNAHLQEFVYIIPFYDTTTMGTNKILFPWCIQNSATRYKGIITFSIKFFQLDINKNIIFEINTLPAQSIIQKGWETEINDISWDQVMVDSQWQDIVFEMRRLVDGNPFAIYWIDVNDIPKIEKEQTNIEQNIINNL